MSSFFTTTITPARFPLMITALTMNLVSAQQQQDQTPPANPRQQPPSDVVIVRQSKSQGLSPGATVAIVFCVIICVAAILYLVLSDQQRRDQIWFKIKHSYNLMVPAKYRVHNELKHGNNNNNNNYNGGSNSNRSGRAGGPGGSRSNRQSQMNTIRSHNGVPYLIRDVDPINSNSNKQKSPKPPRLPPKKGARISLNEVLVVVESDARQSVQIETAADSNRDESNEIQYEEIEECATATSATPQLKSSKQSKLKKGTPSKRSNSNNPLTISESPRVPPGSQSPVRHSSAYSSQTGHHAKSAYRDSLLLVMKKKRATSPLSQQPETRGSGGSRGASSPRSPNHNQALNLAMDNRKSKIMSSMGGIRESSYESTLDFYMQQDEAEQEEDEEVEIEEVLDDDREGRIEVVIVGDEDQQNNKNKNEQNKNNKNKNERNVMGNKRTSMHPNALMADRSKAHIFQSDEITDVETEFRRGGRKNVDSLISNYRDIYDEAEMDEKEEEDREQFKQQDSERYSLGLSEGMQDVISKL